MNTIKTSQQDNAVTNAKPEQQHNREKPPHNAPRRGKWLKGEDELLQKSILLHGEKQWRRISEDIPGRTPIQCLHRWTKILKPGLVKGPWTSEEDHLLFEWVNKEGATKWAQAAQVIAGRNGKQCRERWFNNLNPDMKKGEWSAIEDETIFKMYLSVGSCWSKIAKYLPGRTENSIKNRFYSTIRKLATSRKRLKSVAISSITKLEDNDSVSNVTAGEEKDFSLFTGDALRETHLYKLMAENDFDPETFLNDSKSAKYSGEKRKRKRKPKSSSCISRAKADPGKDLNMPISGGKVKQEEGLIVPSKEAASSVETTASKTPLKILSASNAPSGLSQVQSSRIIPSKLQTNQPSADQKMSLLLEKLSSLETLLHATRTELVSLEKTMSEDELRVVRQQGLLQPTLRGGQGYGIQKSFDHLSRIGSLDSVEKIYLDERNESMRKIRFDDEMINANDSLNHNISELCDEYLVSFH